MHAPALARLDFDPTSAPIETLYATAFSLMERDRVHDAAAVLRVMLHHAPTDERGWLGLGECHARIGQRNIALWLLAAGAVAAKSCRCRLARARIYGEAGFEQLAQTELASARELADGDPELGEVVEQVTEALRWVA